MPGSRSPSLSGPPKRRCHGRKFKKWAAEFRAAAAIPGGSGSSSAASGSSSVAPDSLSVALDSLSAVGLAGSDSEPAAAASPPGGNLVRNRVEFCDFG